MKSLWNDKEAKQCKSDLDLRVYTSRLLGKEPSLVLHGGGNTSVKASVKNLFNEAEEVLYVKGSGWDLATIEAQGFAPVKMDVLLKMAELKNLSDADMVKYQRAAMTDPSAPNPSVEAILHAVIPYKFVDHTHADAIVTITNTPNPEVKIKELFGKKILVIPYIMPGFVLAKLVYDMTKGVNWEELDGLVLMNHGLFTFANDAKTSYEKTIELVTKAENYLKKQGAVLKIKQKFMEPNLLNLVRIRKKVSQLKGHGVIARLNESDLAIHFSQKDIKSIAQRGPLTPDHVIRTKRFPAIIKSSIYKALDKFADEYVSYFEENKEKGQVCLNKAPNYAIWKNQGSISFGKSVKEADIIKDINNHTFKAILKAEKLDSYKALSAKDIFDVEYWELEQAKLKKSANLPLLCGRVAVVTGALKHSLVVQTLHKNGAAVIALDKEEAIESKYNQSDIIGIRCDVKNEVEVKKAVTRILHEFGGLDIIVSGRNYKSLLSHSMNYMCEGLSPSVVLVSARELEVNDLSELGIRINCIHVQNKEAKVEVAKLALAMASDTFAQTNLETIKVV